MSKELENMTEETEVVSRNFIENIIDKDIEDGVYSKKVVTQISTGAEWISAYRTCQVDYC